MAAAGVKEEQVGGEKTWQEKICEIGACNQTESSNTKADR